MSARETAAASRAQAVGAARGSRAPSASAWGAGGRLSAGALLACHAHLRGERLERHRRLGPLMRARVALGGEQARASRGAGRPRTARARACGRLQKRGSVRALRHERRPVPHSREIS